MSDCDVLLDAYLDAFKQETVLEERGGECIMVTPHIQPDGSFITVFASIGEDQVLLHDNGEILQSLFMRGVKVFDKDSPDNSKKLLLDDICRSYGIDVNGWVLSKRTKPQNIGQALIDLVNALKASSDLIYFHQQGSSDTFRFAVRMFMKEKNLSVEANHKISGVTMTHTIDYYRQTKKAEYLLNVVSGTQLNVKVERLGFSYYDIKENNGRHYEWFSIVNPEDEWSKVSLRLLGRFSHVLSWDQKEHLPELIA